MRVTKGDVEISLGPKEFKILSLLMERPGQVYSRAQLLDKVWGHGIYIEDRTVDVHLSRLRKALRAAHEGPARYPAHSAWRWLCHKHNQIMHKIHFLIMALLKTIFFHKKTAKELDPFS